MASADRDETTPATLGRCPTCERMIPRTDLLIRYEGEDGWPKLYAECTACEKTGTSAVTERELLNRQSTATAAVRQ